MKSEAVIEGFNVKEGGKKGSDLHIGHCSAPGVRLPRYGETIAAGI